MRKVFDVVEVLLTKICLVLVICYAVLVAVQVISRYLFNSPITWTEVIARYLFVWSVMIYMPVLYRKHGNPRFDMVALKFKPSTQKMIWVCTDVVVLLTGVALLVFGIKYCLISKRKMVEGLMGLKLPMNVAYSAIPTGGFCLVFGALEQFVVHIGEYAALRKEGK
jgi:TRAP-type C4-dicarboxylate transport system permease small subunit